MDEERFGQVLANYIAKNVNSLQTDRDLIFNGMTISEILFDMKGYNKAKKVIIEPNSPSEGVMVAFIEENGAPIEFIQIEEKNRGGS